MDFNLIKSQIDYLKEHDTSFLPFGSEIHKYQLNPKLDEASILDFEKKEGIKLPNGYRDFLKHIGNGGAGPGYGLYPLDIARNGAGWYPPINDLNNKTKKELDSPGDLLISHNGCALFTWLKINSEKGEIWADGRANNQEPYCINDDFLAWYKNWLDSIFMEKGFITYLGNEAVQLGQRRLFKESIELFRLAVNIKCRQHYNVPEYVKDEYLKIFCNVLYFLQNDNTALPIDIELNNYFLDICLPHGKENPEIYFNAACVYNEMKDFDNVHTCIELAKKHYKDYELLLQTIRTEALFSEFRKKYSF